MELPRPSWNEFEKLFRGLWKQGEHVFICNQTGGGKTELLLKVMPLRRSGIIFCSKPRDPIFKTPEAKDYRRVKTYDEIRSFDHRIMLAPKNYPTPEQTRENQHGEFQYAIRKAYYDGGWTIGGDEVAWMAESLGLSRPIADMHHLGRALGITFVSCTQRPKRLPVIVPQSATYAFVGKQMRRDDRATLAELGGDTRETMAAIDSLRGRHDFVFVDTLSRVPLMIVNTRA